ncbi:hypothetical protein I6F35_06420 [Bradyrhizobium sp. BRP22]|nr:hypothetical protein [Bradyrhizobium sp. BRP22]MCA1452855.1 hypothetical protein [Bradyrhizobium sp. BRP22]
MNTEAERLRARVEALEKMLAELERVLAQSRRCQRLAQSGTRKSAPVTH